MNQGNFSINCCRTITFCLQLIYWLYLHFNWVVLQLTNMVIIQNIHSIYIPYQVWEEKAIPMDSEIAAAGSSLTKTLSSVQKREIHRLPLAGRYKPDVDLHICHQCEQLWAKTCFQASQMAKYRRRNSYFNFSTKWIYIIVIDIRHCKNYFF